MAKIITITIRKGGSAKTTTAVNLASALAKQGKRVLLVDLDSQANASMGLGVIEPENNIARVLDGEITAKDAIIQVVDFWLLPSTPDLTSNEVSMSKSLAPQDYYATRFLLEPIKNDYDFIIIDTPPSGGILTYNALLASDGVIMPTQAQVYAVQGLQQALEIIYGAKKAKPDLELLGILPTMVNERTNIGSLLLDRLRTNGDGIPCLAPIPYTIKLTESNAVCKTLIDYEPKNKASLAYIELANYIIKHYQERA